MFPGQSEIEIPLLKALIQLGGEAKPRDVYPVVTGMFPEIDPEALAERLSHGHSKWHNRIQWVRQSLVNTGDMSSPERGIWAITDQGRKRVADEEGDNSAGMKSPQLKHANLVDIYERYEEQFRSKLLDRLYELTPTQFENFARHILDAYGFVQMTVTQVGRDGGIDGFGLLKVGLARMSVAFQCKKWANNVSRPEIDKFRGAIQGQYEQGIFFTTSDFTKEATEASIRKGAVPIILLNGDSIVDLMINKEIGVQKKPLQVYEDQIDSIFGDDTE